MSKRATKYEFFIRVEHEENLDLVARDIGERTWNAGHCAHEFHPRPGTDNAAQIKDGIREADVFVTLAHQLSETVRREAAWALANDKPVLALLVGPDVHPNELEELRRTIDRGSTIGVAEAVATPADVVNEYLLALHKVVRGLDRTRFLLDSGMELHIPNRFVRKMATMGRVISRRCEKNPFLKKGIADFFCQHNFANLIQSGTGHMFLESGSSIAYVAETIAEDMHAEWTPSNHVEIETNNFLAFVELAAAKKVRVSLYPPGRPDDKYGATLGPLVWVEPDREESMDGEAHREVRKIKEYLKATYKSKGILLGATSGVDLGVECPGFHTGTFAMMLFKRALLEAAMEGDIPLIIFADEDKVPYAFDASTCYSICEGVLSWQKVRADVPLALACSFRSQERAMQVLPLLADLGFAEGQQESDGEIPWCVIAANHKFMSVSKEWFRARRLTLNAPGWAPSRPLLHTRRS